MPASISDLTLETLLEELIADKTVLVSGTGETFRLDNPDSRAALIFYRGHRDYWPPERNITEREVEGLLQSLDQVTTISPRRAVPAPQRRLWHLRMVEAHRFGGLHRHCGTKGEDPPLFKFDVGTDLSLIKGFNGAGKSSLLNAINWGLTGRAFRSQALPAEIHHPVTAERRRVQADDSDVEGTSDENDIADTFELPPVVPMPSDTELAAVEDQPRHDTWVRLTFEPADEGEPVTVTRRLVKKSHGRFETEVEGLDSLALSDLALQVGTVMPGIAAAMRFDERTDLSEAIASLTGLKPLGLFGKRCERLVKRLGEIEVRKTKEYMDDFKSQFERQLAALQDVVRDHPELLSPQDIAFPGEQIKDRSCADTLSAAKEVVERIEAQAQDDVTSILGQAPNLDTPNAVNNFRLQLDDADQQLRGAVLSALPSVRDALAIKALSTDELDAVETLIASIVDEGGKLAELLRKKEEAERWQLYTRVARWHEENHPGQDIETCPVCRTDLDDIPKDAVLDLHVKEALKRCRRTGEYVAKTAAEWERDQARAFVAGLPNALRPFADRDLPDTLISFYERALTTELFDKKDFQGLLARLRANAAAIWEEVSGALPAQEAQVSPSLPAVFPDDNGLQKKLNNIRTVIDMARYRLAHEGEIERAMNKMIGKSVPTKHRAEEYEAPANQLPLRQQLARLKHFAEAVGPIVSAKRQLGEVESLNAKWLKQQSRLSLLARATSAVEVFLQFPEVVHNQVTGLMEELDTKTKTWANSIYRAHYFGAPEYAGLSGEESEALGMRASIGRVSLPAHEVMNASALRTFVWSFVLALWQQIRERSGGLSCFLMDDPQELLDPPNVGNLAATIPDIVGAGMRPIVTSDDYSFISAIQTYAHSRAQGAISQACFDLSPISRSKLVANLLPVVDEILERGKAREEDENNVQKAQDYVEPVRVRIETKLWDLLASDPVTLHDPALADLLDKLRTFRNTGQRPFDERPFQSLLDHVALRPDNEFYRIINKAHHSRSRDITPAEAGVVARHFNEVNESIEACTLAYARFMRRLPPDQATEDEIARPDVPEPVSLPVTDLPVLGRLAARMGASPIDVPGATTEQFAFSELGNIALFRIRSPTLGLACLQGQTVITSLDIDAQRGDLVIALHRKSVFARRLANDPGDPAKIALESILSATSNIPPTHFLPRSGTRLLKIIGVFFDNERAPSPGEAVLVNTAPTLRQSRGLALVVDDSAFPVAKDGDQVLISPIDVDPDATGLPDELTGRIVAVVTRSPESGLEERQAYLKRLGKALPGVRNIRYLENVGQIGEGEYVQFGEELDPRFPDVSVVEQLWRVHGVLYR